MSEDCVSCSMKVRPRQEALQCDQCDKWQHRTCDSGISREEYRRMVKESLDVEWLCVNCRNKETDEDNGVVTEESFDISNRYYLDFSHEMAGVRVTGLDHRVTGEKELTIHFTKPKHGGGKISQIFFPLINNEAVIIFEDASVVDTVLSYDKHTLQGVDVSVSRLPPMVFSTVQAKLEADYSSVVLATDIKDELEIWAHTEISVTEPEGTCVLHGNWYQIERAWQIINRAWSKQQKIQYQLQRQISGEYGQKGSPHGRHYEQLLDNDVAMDIPAAKKSLSEPRPTNRKMQESYMTAIDPNEILTDSVISQTPFEDSVINEVRRMQKSDGEGGSLYSSHRYPLPKTATRENSSMKRSSSELDRINPSQKSNSLLGDASNENQLLQSTGSQSHSLSGSKYDDLFSPVNGDGAESQRRHQADDEMKKIIDGAVHTTGSKTYTVNRSSHDNSNMFDSEEELVTPTRSLLDAVHINTDSGSESETELKSSGTVPPEYLRHRYADQNDTFNKFSEQNKEENPSCHSLPMFPSDRRGGIHNYQLLREIKTGSHDHTGFSNSLSRSQRGEARGSADGGPHSLGYDLSNSRRTMMRDLKEKSQNDLPISARSKVKDTSDTYSYGYGTQLTPITSSSELIALGQVDDGAEDMSRYEFTVGKLKVVVYQGDIVKASTRGLVNAANGYLANGAGVAGAIAMAAGHSMQQECKDIINRQGMLDTGSVVHTTAGGKLSPNVAYILHAVGPIWIEALRSRCNFEMIVTYLNCLKYANKIWLDSITLPCISSGIFGCPLDMSIQSFVDAILLFNSDLEDNNHLEEIHLVNNDLEGVMTSIGLIQSVMENGQDHATAQALNRFNMLSKHHGEQLGERLSKTFTERMQTRDDSLDTRSRRNTVPTSPRRSSSLQRLPKRSEDDRPLTGSSTYLSKSDVSASKISVREKSAGGTSGSSSRTSREAGNEKMSRPLSARSSSSDRHYSPSFSDSLHSSSSSHRTNGTTSIRDSSSTALTSASGSTVLDDYSVGSSYSSLGNEQSHGGSSGKKRQSVSDRLYSQSTHASRGRADGDLLSSSRSNTKKSTPQFKQPLMSPSGGAKPKTTSLHLGGKNNPLKATGNAYLEKEYGTSKQRAVFHDTTSLPRNYGGSNGRRQRGSSPRR